MATTRRGGAAADTGQLLWRVRPAPRPGGTPPGPVAGDRVAGDRVAGDRVVLDRGVGDRGVGDRSVELDGPRCPGVVIEHVDGTSECELGPRCRVGLDDHDVGAGCPGPEHDCPHCRSVFSRCDAPVIEHGPGDGTGPLVCTAGHDAEDLDAAEDPDRSDARVYHPGTATYPCAEANCPRCAATSARSPTG